MPMSYVAEDLHALRLLYPLVVTLTKLRCAHLVFSTSNDPRLDLDVLHRPLHRPRICRLGEAWSRLCVSLRVRAEKRAGSQQQREHCPTSPNRMYPQSPLCPSLLPSSAYVTCSTAFATGSWERIRRWPKKYRFVNVLRVCSDELCCD